MDQWELVGKLLGRMLSNVLSFLMHIGACVHKVPCVKVHLRVSVVILHLCRCLLLLVPDDMLQWFAGQCSFVRGAALEFLPYGPLVMPLLLVAVLWQCCKS